MTIWLSKNIKIFFIVSAVTLALACALVAGSYTHAAQSKTSQFTQKISPMYCDGVPECDLQPPIVSSVHSYNHHLNIYGRFDRLNSQTLTIKFNGVYYTLGVDSQLTVDGNKWKLSLDEDDGLPLDPGNYDIEVIMVTVIGQTLTYTAYLNVSAPPDDGDDSDNNGGNKGDKEPSVTLLPPSTGYMYTPEQYSDGARQSIFDSLAVAGGICMFGLGLLLLAWRVNKR